LAKQRLDKCLVDSGLAHDIKHAQALLLSGVVLVNDQPRDKAGDLVGPDDKVRLKNAKAQKGRFVSRGGEKLYGAILDFDIASSYEGAVALDIGASTGGFTDVLLKLGASKVYALDVGTNQLAWKLRNDPRVESMEKTDIRMIESPIDPAISQVVADVSFNSLTRLLPSILKAVPSQGVQFLLLVKPQFELPSALIPKGGVVTDVEHHKMALEIVTNAVASLGLKPCRVLASRLQGKEGNQEYFLLFET